MRERLFSGHRRQASKHLDWNVRATPDTSLYIRPHSSSLQRFFNRPFTSHPLHLSQSLQPRCIPPSTQNGQIYRPHRPPRQPISRGSPTSRHPNDRDAPQDDLAKVHRHRRDIVHHRQRRGHHRRQLALGPREKRLHQLLHRQRLEHEHLQGRQVLRGQLCRRRCQLFGHIWCFYQWECLDAEVHD